jgi:hypothetical protein
VSSRISRSREEERGEKRDVPPRISKKKKKERGEQID